MGHPTRKSVTGDSLPVSWIRYRRLIAYFSDPLQETIACCWDPFTLTISGKSAILKLKEGDSVDNGTAVPWTCKNLKLAENKF